MNKFVVGFAAGMLTGVLAAYIFVKKNYDISEAEVVIIEKEVKPKVKDEEVIFEEKMTEEPETMDNILDDYDTLSEVEKEVHLISEDDFFGDTDYDKVSMVYYIKHDILVDMDSDKIIKADNCIENVMDLQEELEDVDVIYVRNHKLEIDYEITKHEGEVDFDNVYYEE